MLSHRPTEIFYHINFNMSIPLFHIVKMYNSFLVFSCKCLSFYNCFFILNLIILICLYINKGGFVMCCKRQKLICFILVILMLCGLNHRNIYINFTPIYTHTLDNSHLLSSSIRSFEKEFFESDITDTFYRFNTNTVSLKQKQPVASLRITLYFLCLAVFVLHKLRFLINFNISSPYISTFIELIIKFIHKSDGKKASYLQF